MENQRDGKDMSEFLQANIAQGKAVERLNPEHDTNLDIKIMLFFGHEWRIIINQFLESEGRVPDEDDLIYCSSLDDHFDKDIRLIVQELKQQ